MKNNLLFLFVLSALSWSCQDTAPKGPAPIYESEALKILPLTENTFIHVSYLNDGAGEKIPCNGLVYIHNGEAFIVDTPVEGTAGLELISWIEETKQAKMVGVTPTHFHIDCIGTLQLFLDRGVRSYAQQATKDILNQIGAMAMPAMGFQGKRTYLVGGSQITLHFLGEGHTKDNMVVYVKDEEVLFGGCLIKAMDADKGNLADANEAAWSKTVGEVKSVYDNAKHIVPGHGNPGGRELLDYTIALFQ